MIPDWIMKDPAETIASFLVGGNAPKAPAVETAPVDVPVSSVEENKPEAELPVPPVENEIESKKVLSDANNQEIVQLEEKKVEEKKTEDTLSLHLSTPFTLLLQKSLSDPTPVPFAAVPDSISPQKTEEKPKTAPEAVVTADVAEKTKKHRPIVVEDTDSEESSDGGEFLPKEDSVDNDDELFLISDDMKEFEAAKDTKNTKNKVDAPAVNPESVKKPEKKKHEHTNKAKKKKHKKTDKHNKSKNKHNKHHKHHGSHKNHKV